MTNDLSNFWLDTKYRWRFFATSSPILFEVWRKLRKKSYPHVVSAKTDITIEGFPRSGNTFAVAAFEFSQKEKLIIARHTHSIAQVIKSIQFRIPTLILIRQPREAVISLAIREKIPINTATLSYISYYKKLFHYRKDICLAPFNKVTGDFGEVITSLNKKFCTNFVPYNATEENLRKVFNIIDDMELKFSGSIDETKVARPSEQRKSLQKKLEEIYALQPKQLVKKAENIYNLFAQDY